MEEAVLFFVKSLGVAGAFFLMWYLTYLIENRRWNQMQGDAKAQRVAEAAERAKREEHERAQRDKDAAEHMEKWRSMMAANSSEVTRLMDSNAKEVNRLIDFNKSQVDKAYELLNREVEVNEANAAAIQQILSQIQQRGFCPNLTPGG